MKQFTIAFFCVMMFISLQAQKDFEGKINYYLHNEAASKEDAHLTITFRKNKIKFALQEGSNQDSVDNRTLSILYIDSGKIYTLSKYDSTYTVKVLRSKRKIELPSKRTIAGHSTTPSLQDPKASIFGNYLSQTNTIFYTSDSLHYTVPDKFENNMEFIFVNNNKIVLAAEAYIDYSGMIDDLDTSKTSTKITAEATEVIPMQIPDSEFEIPSFYVYSKDKYRFDNIAVDSIAMTIDTAAEIIDSPEPPPPPKKITPKRSGHKPPPRKKTSTTKSSAIIRKP